jgi:hypothetical protein
MSFSSSFNSYYIFRLWRVHILPRATVGRCLPCYCSNFGNHKVTELKVIFFISNSECNARPTVIPLGTSKVPTKTVRLPLLVGCMTVRYLGLFDSMSRPVVQEVKVILPDIKFLKTWFHANYVASSSIITCCWNYTCNMKSLNYVMPSFFLFSRNRFVCVEYFLFQWLHTIGIGPTLTNTHP